MASVAAELRAAPTRHDDSGAALKRMASGSVFTARETFSIKTKVAKATLKAPKLEAPRLRAMRTLTPKLVALEKI
jgi:hypothetical protein